MKFSSVFLASFGPLASLGMQKRESWEFPFDLGVNLVFPRPNETYRPVYPFPVVFAITGAAEAWPYQFNFRWSLEGNHSWPIRVDDRPLVSDKFPEKTTFTRGQLEPAAEPYYYITGTDLVVNSTSTEWLLIWRLQIAQECEPGEYGSYGKVGQITFSTSPNGSLPSMSATSGKPCPFEALHLRFLENGTTPEDVKRYRYSNSCVVVTDQEGSGDPCKIDTGSKLKSLVTAKMLETASCPVNQSWPDEENLRGPESCSFLYPEPAEEDAANTLSHSMAFWAAVGTFALGLYILAVADAENSIQSNLTTLVGRFAPDVDNSGEFNLVADMVGVVMGMFSAPVFNKMIRNGAPADDLKDLVANSVSWGAMIAKDVQNSKRDTNEIKVAGKLGELSAMWKEATTTFMEQVFRGDNKSVDYVSEMIADGKKVFYAILIPEAWRVGAGLAPAFITDSGYDCNAVGPLDNGYISPSTTEVMGYCHKGWRYYILAPNGDATSCSNQSPPGNGRGPPCSDRYFTAPQSIDELTGGKWEGITKEQLIVGTIEGWKLKGEKNRGGFIDTTKAENYDFLLDEGGATEIDIKTPAIVQIPVCSPEKARHLWKYGSSLSSSQKVTLLDTLPNYPCPN
ncbi:hypothetical protein LRP88_01279 [Fusarium phalaenopsidis]